MLTNSLGGLTDKFWDEPTTGTSRKNNANEITRPAASLRLLLKLWVQDPLPQFQVPGGQNPEASTDALALQLLLKPQELEESTL